MSRKYHHFQCLKKHEYQGNCEKFPIRPDPPPSPRTIKIFLNFRIIWNTNIEYLCSSQPYRIQISNIFVLSNLAEYEYWIYSKQENWIFVFEYVIFGGYYSNIRIYSCHTETRCNNNNICLTYDFYYGWVGWCEKHTEQSVAEVVPSSSLFKVKVMLS